MNIFKHFVFILFLFAVCVVVVTSIGLHEEFTWTRINYEWPREGEISSRFAYSSSQRSRKHFQRPYKNEANPIFFEGPTNIGGSGNNGSQGNENQNNSENNEIAPGSLDYQYENNIPMAANVWKDKLFISVPRRRPGIPSTLNYVSLNSKERHNVPLKPYPSWDINLYPDTSGKGENFVSVYRIGIDECDRMWLVDTGIMEFPGNRTRVRPQHQIIVINLLNDQIIHKYTLPDSVVTPASTLASLTVDVTKDNCGDAYVYFPDLAGFGVTVYSLKENHAWRVNHNYFFPESTKGEFFIAGFNFQWNDGVFSIQLSDIKPDGFRDMYFHPMAGTHAYKVSTKIIRNETLATRSYHGSDFQVIGDRGPNSQTATADIHKPTEIMFLGMINKNALGCWNINKDLSTLSIVHMDDAKMIYPSDVKIVGDKVYVLTNTMPGALYGRLDYDKINFRVWSNDISSAIKGTMCRS